MPPVDPAADQGHEAAKAQQEAATAATREALAKIKVCGVGRGGGAGVWGGGGVGNPLLSRCQ